MRRLNFLANIEFRDELSPGSLRTRRLPGASGRVGGKTSHDDSASSILLPIPVRETGDVVMVLHGYLRFRNVSLILDKRPCDSISCHDSDLTSLRSTDGFIETDVAAVSKDFEAEYRFLIVGFSGGFCIGCSCSSCCRGLKWASPNRLEFFSRLQKNALEGNSTQADESNSE